MDGVLPVKAAELPSRQIRKLPGRQVYRRAQRRTLRTAGIRARRGNPLESSIPSSYPGVYLRSESQRLRNRSRTRLKRPRHQVVRGKIQLPALHAGASTERVPALGMKVGEKVSSPFLERTLEVRRRRSRCLCRRVRWVHARTDIPEVKSDPQFSSTKFPIKFEGRSEKRVNCIFEIVLKKPIAQCPQFVRCSVGGDFWVFKPVVV